MATTTHKVAAVLSMAFAALALAVSLSTVPQSHNVAGNTSAAPPPPVADLDW